MSLQDLVWALQQKDITPTEKLTLICLANYTDDRHRCWPGVATLSDDTGLSRPTIHRVFQTLQAKSLLRVDHRIDKFGRNSSNLYHLLIQPVGAPDGERHGSHLGSPSETHPLNGELLGSLGETRSEDLDPDPDPEDLDSKKNLTAGLESPSGGSILELQLKRSIELVQNKKKLEASWPEEDRWLYKFVQEQRTFDPRHAAYLLDYAYWDDLSELTNGMDRQFVTTEFVRMRRWFDENPQKQPTPRGVRRFVRRWLERAAERARLYVPTHSNGRYAAR